MSMKIQRILYNQLHKDYIQDDVERVVVLERSWPIETGTSAGTLSLNIYSKLMGYASWKAFAESLEYGDWLQVGSWIDWLHTYCEEYNVDEVVVMEPAEPYVVKRLEKVQKALKQDWVRLTILPNSQFLIDHQTFTDKYPKPPVMETFYRWMRKKTRILMDWTTPEWGKWNYDKENRKFDKTFEDTTHLTFPENPYRDEACDHYAESIKAWWKTPERYLPVTREEAVALLDYFVKHSLDRFGELEDAMYTTSDFVYHSLLSIPLNFGLLTPQEVISAVDSADTAINNKEWFIRQVLWRREYMYHRFLAYHQTIYTKNHFDHARELPERFWKPDTSSLRMNCVNNTLEKVDRLWYSHHIERLMIIWNFCLLVWFNPHHVNKRFREQYADAFERVVTPNVLWMSQYADWWNLATKPYVASANYVKKMSNFCKECYYNPKEKYWEKACPLNYLYWNFVDTNQETFKQWRQHFILKHLEKLDMKAIRQQTQEFIDSL